MTLRNAFFLHLLALTLCNTPLLAQVQQKTIDRVSQMPDMPRPFKIINFNALAKDFDRKIYDFNAKGKYWPMIWIDSSKRNFPQNVAGIYTAVGDVRQGLQNHKGIFHEALTTMGAVLGASLVGIDKSAQQYNYVAMLKNYFNKETGWNIMMNNTCPEVALLGGGYGRDWWYDVYPNVLFYSIYSLYPGEEDFEEIARSIAERFYAADSVLQGNYNYSFFNYATLTPTQNQICIQPDAAAGQAWVLYMAYKKFGDKKYLRGAINAIKALLSLNENMTYELLMPYGAYVAAMLNAEEGQQFDFHKILDWSFDGDAKCREGWGVLTGNWNGFDISGMVGSTVHNGGYGFLMNTYDLALPLLPMVRYDASYAAAVGKWMLNAANVARLFYPQHMPANHQTLSNAMAISKGVIAYEGIIKKSLYKESQHLAAPVAQGDGPLWVQDKNPEASQLSVYGSGHVGIFGGTIQTTNIPGILQLDLLAADFFHQKAYPTHLYTNPYAVTKIIMIQNQSKQPVDLYNTLEGKFVARNIRQSFNYKIGPKKSAVLVQVPAGATITRAEGKLWANKVVIDFKAG